MVNGEWRLRAARIERQSFKPGDAQRLFTIYDSLFTTKKMPTFGSAVFRASVSDEERLGPRRRASASVLVC